MAQQPTQTAGVFYAPDGHAVRIEGSRETWGTHVFLDGQELKGVKEVRLVHRAGNVSTLFLELYPSSVTVEGAVAVVEVSAANSRLMLEAPKESEPCES